MFGIDASANPPQCPGPVLQELHSLYTLLFTNVDSAEHLCNMTLLLLVITLTHMNRCQTLPCVQSWLVAHRWFRSQPPRDGILLVRSKMTSWKLGGEVFADIVLMRDAHQVRFKSRTYYRFLCGVSLQAPRSWQAPQPPIFDSSGASVSETHAVVRVATSKKSSSSVVVPDSQHQNC